MDELTNWLTSSIENNPASAGLLFAAMAFAESTAFVGIIVPATPVLLLVGTLIGFGKLDPLQLVPAAIAGAIAGYALSYYVGRALGPRLTRTGWLRSQRRPLAHTRLFFRRYGGASLILGRYLLGPLQSLLPLVAGAAGMDRRRFWPANLLSGLIWVPLCLAPGYLAARASTELGVALVWQQRATAFLAFLSIGSAAAAILYMVLRVRRHGQAA
jgi:membrane protein DedA with SNARE-associated domain